MLLEWVCAFRRPLRFKSKNRVPKLHPFFVASRNQFWKLFEPKWRPKYLQNCSKIYFFSIGYSLMQHLDFCNTSLSKTSLLRLLSLPKIIKFRFEGPFSHLQKHVHKLEQLQTPILMKFGSKNVPKLDVGFYILSLCRNTRLRTCI